MLPTMLRSTAVLISVAALAPPAWAQPAPNVYWADWTAVHTSSVVGTLDVAGSTVSIAYFGERAFVQTSGGADYWSPSTGFISPTIPNRPTGTDIIALSQRSPKRLEFSAAVTNPLFAVVSLNGNGYRFDRDFDIVSFACGYWGCGTLAKRVTPPLGGVAGDPGTTYDLIGTGEPHGVIQFIGTFSSVSWDSLTDEYWNGFTIAITDLAANVFPEIRLFDGPVELTAGQLLDLGPLTTGSSTLTLTIANAGTGPLTLSSVRFAGTSSRSFSLPVRLPPAIAATSSVTFDVVATGTPTDFLEAVLEIASDDVDEPVFELRLTAGDGPVALDAGPGLDAGELDGSPPDLDAAAAPDAPQLDAAPGADATAADGEATALDAAPSLDATTTRPDAGLLRDAAAATDSGDTSPEDAGCSCRSGSRPGAAPLEVSLLLLALALGRRRARRPTV